MQGSQSFRGPCRACRLSVKPADGCHKSTRSEILASYRVGIRIGYGVVALLAPTFCQQSYSAAPKWAIAFLAWSRTNVSRSLSLMTLSWANIVSLGLVSLATASIAVAANQGVGVAERLG